MAATQDTATSTASTDDTVTLAKQVLAADEANDDAKVLELALKLAQAVVDAADAASSDQAKRTDASGKAIILPDEFNAMTRDELVALQERDPDLYERSLRAAAKS